MRPAIALAVSAALAALTSCRLCDPAKCAGCCDSNDVCSFSCSSDSGAGGGAQQQRAAIAVNLELKNDYAESLFTVDLTPRGGEAGVPLVGAPVDTAVRALESARIPGSDTVRKPDALSIDPTETLDLSVDAVSLGQHHRFTASVGAPSARAPTLRLSYDYDLALAEFRLQYGWGQ